MYLNKPFKVFKCKILEFNTYLNTYETLKMTWINPGVMEIVQLIIFPEVEIVYQLINSFAFL